MNKFLGLLIGALILISVPATAQPSKCNDFTEFVSAVQAQNKADIKFDVLDDNQIKILVQTFGEIPFTGYDRVIVMHNTVAGMILFTKGNCVLGRSNPIDYGELSALLGIQVSN
jgi:hypothetical protein